MKFTNEPYYIILKVPFSFCQCSLFPGLSFPCFPCRLFMITRITAPSIAPNPIYENRITPDESPVLTGGFFLSPVSGSVVSSVVVSVVISVVCSVVSSVVDSVVVSVVSPVVASVVVSVVSPVVVSVVVCWFLYCED